MKKNCSTEKGGEVTSAPGPLVSTPLLLIEVGWKGIDESIENTLEYEIILNASRLVNVSERRLILFTYSYVQFMAIFCKE